jgi:hypothetical protein
VSEASLRIDSWELTGQAARRQAVNQGKTVRHDETTTNLNFKERVDRAANYRLHDYHDLSHPPQAQKVVLAGNIGKVSQQLGQPREGLSLQTRRMTDDDPGAAFAAGP